MPSLPEISWDAFFAILVFGHSTSDSDVLIQCFIIIQNYIPVLRLHSHDLYHVGTHTKTSLPQQLSDTHAHLPVSDYNRTSNLPNHSEPWIIEIVTIWYYYNEVIIVPMKTFPCFTSNDAIRGVTKRLCGDRVGASGYMDGRIQLTKE